MLPFTMRIPLVPPEPNSTTLTPMAPMRTAASGSPLPVGNFDDPIHLDDDDEDELLPPQKKQQTGMDDEQKLRIQLLNFGRQLDLCPGSDVVLVIGEGSCRVTIDAEVLKKVSVSFRNLFNDGDGLFVTQTPTPRTIALPEDHENSLIMVLNILHHQPELLPQGFIQLRIYHMAVLATKYDCMRIISPHLITRWPITTHWINRVDELDPNNEQVCKRLLLMTAAWLMRHKAHFERCSNAVICLWKGTGMGELETHQAMQHLPTGIIWKLSEARQILLMEMCRHYGQSETPPPKKEGKGGKESAIAGSLTPSKNRIDLTDTSVLELYRAFEKLDSGSARASLQRLGRISLVLKDDGEIKYTVLRRD